MTRRTLVASAVVGGAAMVAVVAVTTLSGGSGDDALQAASQSTATTTILRQDLVERESVDGTLGYSDARKVINRLAGTVTWTPRVGSVVRTNHRLYAVDGEDVYLLDGAYPAYRTLQAGLSGRDVLSFERNMRALGMDPDGAMTVDGTWDAGTTAAAKRWQESKGVTADGSIEKGRIVFQPGARRVGAVRIPVGSSASGVGGGGNGSNSPAAHPGDTAPVTIMVAAHTDAPASGSSEAGARAAQAPATTTPAQPTTTTPTTTPARPTTTTPQPTATPRAATRTSASGSGAGARRTTSGESAGASGRSDGSGTASASASGGADVASELMTTTSTKRIVAIDLETTKRALARRGARVVVDLPDGGAIDGTIATVGAVAQRKATSQNDDPPATIKVVVRLRGSVGSGLDQAPVDVQLERRRARDALTVPVTALLARAGTGYAVEVRDGARRRVVEVRTGIYTDSYVEIDGPGLRAGMTVTNSAI